MKIRTEAVLSLVLLACSSSESGGGGTGGGASQATSGGGGGGTATAAGTTTVASSSQSSGAGEGGTGGDGGAPSGGGAGGGGGTAPFPSPEECEQYQTEADCHAAGCALFMEVTFAWPEGEDICADSATEVRDVCFQLDPLMQWSYPASGFWHRETDAGLEVTFMASSYCGLLGWTACKGTPDDPSPLCNCIDNPCGNPR